MVAVAVAVSGGNALAIAHAAFVQGCARAIVLVGCRIVVACVLVGASQNGDGEVEVHRAKLVVAFEEHLDIQVATEDAIGGQLRNQDPMVVAGNAIGVSGLGEPRSAGDVRQFEAASRCAISRFEQGLPRVLGGLNREHVAFAVGGVGLRVDADGDEAVELVGWEGRPHCGHHAARGDVPDGIGLKEVAGCDQCSGSVNIAKYSADLIGGIGSGDIQPVAVVVGQVRVREGANVGGHGVNLDAEILRLEDVGVRQGQRGFGEGGLRPALQPAEQGTQQEDPSPDGMA